VKWIYSLKVFNQISFLYEKIIVDAIVLVKGRLNYKIATIFKCIVKFKNRNTIFHGNESKFSELYYCFLKYQSQIYSPFFAGKLRVGEN
jgi:hypothetical protein